MRTIMSVFTALALMLIAAGAVQASIHIQAGDYIRMRDGNGGHGGVFWGQEKDASGLVGDKFATFCVEVAEYIVLDRTYYVDDVSDTTSVGNPLTPLAAWIYSDFLDNEIDFLPEFVPALHDGTAMYHNTVQMAIWMTITGLSESVADNYVNSAGYNHDWLLALLDHDYGYSPTDYRGVQIMNLLTAPNGTNIQDQLVRMMPEPAAFAVWAVLFGSVAVKFGRRRTDLTNPGCDGR